VFNDDAFEAIDAAINVARAQGLRLVIPLVDNYRYFSGGRFVFTDWRGLTDPSCGLACEGGNAFYTDARVIDDYEQYVAHLLTHVNARTGVAYRDDPTILAWETGNEVNWMPRGYHAELLAWTQTIAGFIKSVAPNQLVVDGYVGDDRDERVFAIRSVDLYTGHYYPMRIDAAKDSAQRAAATGKVFFVGEFDWINLDGGDRLDAFLSALEADANVSGDLYWSLFPHGDLHGLVQHLDGYTLHYPGDDLDARTRAELLRRHAFAIRGLPVPDELAPGAPLVTRVHAANGRYDVAWRGVATAWRYSVEVSRTGPSGPWTVACDQCATDNDTPWTDPLTPVAPATWYRVRAHAACGIPGGYSDPYPADPAAP
jgi:hypothetical protein